MYTPTFAEFFSGGGMVRAALGQGWACVLANDIDHKKCAAYRKNWGDENLVQGDIGDLNIDPLRRPVDLYWASSPCQDFSSAGHGLGLKGSRSSVFLKWIDKVSCIVDSGFAPQMIAFENVAGLLSKSRASDLSEIFSKLCDVGYRVGGLEIDAKNFLPQSRPRLFLVAVHDKIEIPDQLISEDASSPFHTSKVCAFEASLSPEKRSRWIWWRLKAPTAPVPELADLLDSDAAVHWHSSWQTQQLLHLMSPLNQQKIMSAVASKHKLVGTLYRRGRPNEAGVLRQQAEVRFDGVAGCIRTPVGGSSRQIVVQVADGQVRTRLMSSGEALRLMGLPDSYHAPTKSNEAYKIAGDGVCVPVVRYLRDEIFDKILISRMNRRAA